MPATDLWLPDRSSLSRPAGNGIQPTRQAITQRHTFISHHQFRSLPIPGALTEPVVCNCMRADYSFRRDLSALPA
jgi:hypothetical protein